MVVLSPLCLAQEAGAASTPAAASGGPGAEFAAHLHRLEAQVEACKTLAKACGTDAGPDDKITSSPAGEYTVRWNWLRDALKDAGTSSPEQRADAMEKSAARLKEIAAETGVAQNAESRLHRDADDAAVRQKTTEILSRPEFNRKARPPSLWERLLARLQRLLSIFFGGVGELGAKAPWLGAMLEWVLFLGAAVVLMLMVLRIFARQRMQVAMAVATQAGVWSREAQDWAAEAERWAQLQEWREAVHCLYWAAIVRLEARRAWRHNPSRTPREYVRLLKPGSAQQSALRTLTGIFERVWYGLRDAQAADYQRARTLFDGLSEPAREPAASEPAA
jgi:hypothetical protein